MPYGFSLANSHFVLFIRLRKLVGYSLVNRAGKANVCYAAACFSPALVLFRLFADVSKDTAIHIEDVSVDCIGCLRSKEYSGTGQLFGL